MLYFICETSQWNTYNGNNRDETTQNLNGEPKPEHKKNQKQDHEQDHKTFFSGKIKKNISKCRQLKYLISILSIKSASWRCIDVDATLHL